MGAKNSAGSGGARWPWFSRRDEFAEPGETIGDQIADIFITHEGLSKKQAWARSSELLGLVQIDPSRLKSYPHQLSGGMGSGW